MAKAPFHTQLLTIDSSDTTPSLLFVGSDGRRYLFNAPEAVSRVCIQSKLPMKKIERVFLGDLARSAGLPGLLLSICEGGGRDVRIHGPQGSLHLLASCRFFTRRDQMTVDVQEHVSASTPVDASMPIHEDSNVSVRAFVLSPSNVERAPRGIKRKRSQSPIADAQNGHRSASPRPASLEGEEAQEWRRKVVADMFKGSGEPVEGDSLSRYESAKRNGPSPAYLAKSLPQYTGSRGEAICYVACTPEQRGRFLPQKAKEKGVRPGQAFKKLTEGERVWVPKVEMPATSPEGAKLTKSERQKEAKKMQDFLRHLEEMTVPGEGEGHWVTPEECLEPSLPGKAFAILSVPTTEHLSSLLALPPFDTGNSRLDRVYYFLGPGVLSDVRLSEFASKFNRSVRHHICSPDLPNNNSVTFVPAALLNLRLSLMDPLLFRPPARTLASDVSVPQLEGWPDSVTVSQRDERMMMGSGSSQEQPQTILAFDFAISSSEADTAMAQLKSLNRPAELLARAKEVWKNYVVEAKDIRERIAAMPLAERQDEYVVTPLGTGSAIPSKYRNVSSTLLHLPRDRGYVLLDAGEGTLGQLRRHFGNEEAGNVLRSLKLISISHMHQDHHAGLASILRARKEAVEDQSTPPLIVIAPNGAQMYITEQNELFDLGLYDQTGSSQVIFVDPYRLEPKRSLDESGFVGKALDRLYADTGIDKIVTVPVLHRCRCWGIVISHVEAGKAVFSGDTMPCDALVEHGQDASLLIHEATIDDSMPEVAVAKGHSTFGQAIDIGKRMKAKYILLTHFSARYPKVPPLEEQSEDGGDGCGSRVAIAFDMCTLRMSDWDKMKELQRGMNVLFSLDD